MNLGRINIRDLDKELQKFDTRKIKYASRKLGIRYLSAGIPNKILPEEFNSRYRTSMDFLSIMLGSQDSTEASKKGFAKYSYDSEIYPLKEGSLSEMAIWSFAQGAASIVHQDYDHKMNMYAKIKRSKNRVIVESRKREDWDLKDYPQLF